MAALLPLGALPGCSEPPPEPPAPTVALSDDQARVLAQMNQAGEQAYEGRTWQYQFVEPCVLRVQKVFEGRVEADMKQPLADSSLRVTRYHLGGFGVKAHEPMGGSIDLYDSTSKAKAAAFAEIAEDAIASCASQKTAARR